MLAGQEAAHRVDRDLGHAVGLTEVVDRQLVVSGDLCHVVVPDERRPIGREHVLDRAEVAVADPDAGDDRAGRVIGVVRVAGEVAVGLEVLEVVRGPGLQRGRPPAAIFGLELEARAPQRVGGGVGVVGQDVRDEVRRGRGEDLVAVAGIGGVVVDDVAVRVLDALDEVRLHQPALVRDRAVCAGQIDLVNAEGPEGQRRHRELAVVAWIELEAEPLGHGDHVLGTDELLRLRDRDVQRVLQRVPHADRAALAVVGVGRIEAVGDVGPDVHEHRGRADDAGLEARGIRDRLEGGPGLAVGLADDVEVRLVLRRRPAVERGGPDIREHGAGAVVDRHDRVVVDVAALELRDPGQRILAVFLDKPLVAQPIHVVADARPLLREALVAPVVEGGVDGETAGVEQILSLEQLVRLASHRVHEVRRAVPVVPGRRQDDLLCDRLVVLLLGDEVRPEHLGEHEVAHDDGLCRRRDHVDGRAVTLLLDSLGGGVEA